MNTQLESARKKEGEDSKEIVLNHPVSVNSVLTGIMWLAATLLVLATVPASAQWDAFVREDEFTDAILALKVMSNSDPTTPVPLVEILCNEEGLQLEIYWPDKPGPGEIILDSVKSELSGENITMSEYRIDNGEIKTIEMVVISPMYALVTGIKDIDGSNMQLLEYIVDLQSGSRLRMRSKASGDSGWDYAHLDISLAGASEAITIFQQRCAKVFGIEIR